LKYDLDGNLIWNVTWGGGSSDFGRGVFVYGDYIYVVGDIGYSDVFLLKYDLDGNLIWDTTWGGDTLASVFVYDNYIYATGDAGNDVYLLKYDLNGNLIWDTTWGGNLGDFGNGVFVYEDYIYVVGTTWSFGAGYSDVCLLKYDLDGNLIWNVTWGGSDNDFGESVFVYGDYIYVAGTTCSFGAGGSDVCLLKYDSDDDGDGLGNHQESELGTDPLDADSDDDGFLDGVEVAEGTDPLDPSDNPRVRYYHEIASIVGIIIVILVVCVFVWWKRKRFVCRMERLAGEAYEL